MTVFENIGKSELWQMYWRGYQNGRNVEEMTELDKRAARKQFERYMSREYE